MLCSGNDYRFFEPLLGACVNADAATDFTFLGVFGFESSFPAFEATFFEVLSFLPIAKKLN
jgi:hypothetical protein